MYFGIHSFTDQGSFVGSRPSKDSINFASGSVVVEDPIDKGIYWIFDMFPEFK